MSKQDKPISAKMISAIVIAALALLVLIPYISNGTLFSVTDFSAFYAAGKFVQSQTPSDIYTLSNYRDFYSGIFSNVPNGYGWFYPPHFLLLNDYLAQLSWENAKIAWLVATYSVFLLSVRFHAHSLADWIFLGLAPAALMNLYAGQTGFLAAGLVGFFLYYATEQSIASKIRAGTALGLLTFKPHLWLFLPVYLILTRRWMVAAVASLTLGVLALLSIVIYGVDPWIAMFEGVIGGYSDIHKEDDVLVGKMSTLLALVTVMLGAEFRLPVYGIAFLLSCAALLVLIKKQAPMEIIAAFVISICFVLAPHNMQYDFMVLLIPVVLAWRHLAALSKFHLGIGILPYIWPYIAVFVPGAATFNFGAIIMILYAGTLFHCGMVVSLRHRATKTYALGK